MTDKHAVTATPIHDIIARRWSPRTFADRPVEPATLLALLEAARWAASSRNEQPWRFLVATRETPADYERLFNCLNEGNQQWAVTAPVLILPAAKRRFTNRDNDNRFAMHDLGQAVAQLLAQATALDLYAHQMGGYNRDAARAEFAVPEDFDLGAVIALGYLGDIAALPEDQRQRHLAQRSRKPLSELVFAGRWDAPADWVK